PCPSPNSDINGDGIPDQFCGITLKNEPDPLQNIYFANIVWSPIYGKLALFSKKIFHFDLYVTAGGGLYDNKHKDKFAFNVGFGTKFFMNDFMSVIIDFRDIIV